MNLEAQGDATATPPSVAGDGLTILFDNTTADAKNVDIVLVHGLNGHPRKTWSHSQTGFYWPWELRSHLKHSRVMTFGYNADATSQIAENFVRIKVIANKLLNALANERISDEELTRPIIFIGHSLGGLVSKMAAVQASDAMAAQVNDIDKLYPSIRAFFFFGVPHGGSAALGKKRVWVMEKMAKAAFTEIPPKLRTALEASSDELLDLTDRFRLISLYVENKLVIASFFELLATSGLGDRVVDESSAFVAYAKANPAEPINADHVGMVKFKDAQDSAFSNIRKQLQRVERKLVAPDSSILSPPNLVNLNTIQDIYNVSFTGLKFGDLVALASRLNNILDVNHDTDRIPSGLNLSALNIETLTMSAPPSPSGSASPVTKSAPISRTHSQPPPIHRPLVEDIDVTSSIELRPKPPQLRLDTSGIDDHNSDSAQKSPQTLLSGLSPSVSPTYGHHRSISEPGDQGRGPQQFLGGEKFLHTNMIRSTPGSPISGHAEAHSFTFSSRTKLNLGIPESFSINARLQPSSIALLCFDGGGVRVLSSLLILKKTLEAFAHEIGQKTLPKPCECFDLIGGSSVGGMAAILLGIYELSIDEAIDIFTDALPRIFRHKKQFTTIRTLVGQARFSSTNLATVLKDVEKRATGSSIALKFRSSVKRKCVTCVTIVESQCSQPVLLSTSGESPFNLYLTRDTTVREVAMACVAAPTYFEPQMIGGHHFFDGSLGANNPTLMILQEAKRRWNIDPDELGICLSIGTGRSSRSVDVSKSTSIASLISLLSNMTTETERTESIVAGMFEDVLDAGQTSNPVYFRFSATGDMDSVELDNWEAFSKVSTITRDFLARSQISAQVDRAASALEARFLEGFTSRFSAGTDTVEEMVAGAEDCKAFVHQLQNYFSKRMGKLERKRNDLETERTRLENELDLIRKKIETLQGTAVDT